MPMSRIAICAGLLMPLAAKANCARDVQDRAPKVGEIKDEATRQQAQDYLQRAKRELDENDEFECQTAIEAVDKLMKPQTAK